MASPFTLKYNTIAPALNSDVGISIPAKTVENIVSCEKKTYKALWDTGATHSVITSKVVEDLKLIPTGMTEVITAGGRIMQETHLINMYLPNGFTITYLKVTVCKEVSADPNDNVEVIIGMDIITKGDFAVTNKNNKTWMSFRMPSIGGIDFTKKNSK